MAFGRESAFPHLKASGLLSLEGDGEEFFVGEGFEGAFEGGGGDVGGATKVIVANRACALPASEVPKAEVNRLFGGTEVGKYSVQQFGEAHAVDIARRGSKGKKGRGHEMLRRGMGRGSTPRNAPKRW